MLDLIKTKNILKELNKKKKPWKGYPISGLCYCYLKPQVFFLFNFKICCFIHKKAFKKKNLPKLF